METTEFDNKDDLEFANKTLKKIFKKTTDIYETDVSFSFRVFSEDGKRCILFYEFKKDKTFIYTSEMRKSDKEAKLFYNNHLKYKQNKKQ